MKRWSEIRVHNGMRKLFVDGEPFLAIGIQYAFANCGRIQDFDYLFQHTVAMGLNTVYFPVQWDRMEPAEGKYDLAVFDHALKRCRQKALRMTLLWFGSNQGAGCRPTPAWVTEDRGRFPRALNDELKESRSLCTENPELLRVEKRAFNDLLRHLEKVDGKHHTVILMQVENEPGIHSIDPRCRGEFGELDDWQLRCHCPVCEAKAEKMNVSDWEFGVRSLAGYLHRLLADQKRIFPVPTYTNFAISGPYVSRPGNDVRLYRRFCRNLDFVTPDFYGVSAENLAFTMRHFSEGGNMPFIAETATESTGETDRYLYRTILDHGAQGYDPWAIDHPFGWHWCIARVAEKQRPVSRDGKWSDAMIAYGRAARSLRNAMRQIARAMGSEDLWHYISPGDPFRLEERKWGVFWRFENGKDGKWVTVKTGPDDFTVTGVDTVVTVLPLDPRDEIHAQEGRWDGNIWNGAGQVPVRKLYHRTRRPDRQPTYDLDLSDGRTFRVRLIRNGAKR